MHESALYLGHRAAVLLGEAGLVLAGLIVAAGVALVLFRAGRWE